MHCRSVYTYCVNSASTIEKMTNRNQGRKGDNFLTGVASQVWAWFVKGDQEFLAHPAGKARNLVTTRWLRRVMSMWANLK